MDRSLGFGSPDADNAPLSDSLSLRLRLYALTTPAPRNSPVHSSIGTRLAQPCGIGLSRLVSTRFQILFHSPSGVLFTFPSRYSFTIGHQDIFSLGRWSSQLPTGFLVPRGTRDTDRKAGTFRLRDYHPLRCGFPAGFDYTPTCSLPPGSCAPGHRSHNPTNATPQSLHADGLGSSPFARHY